MRKLGTKHSPTPWHAKWIRPDPARGHTFAPTCSILAPNADPSPSYRGEYIRVADIPDPIDAESEANAEYIVTCVNAHDALVSALRDELADLYSENDSMDPHPHIIARIGRLERALKLAEGN